MMRIFQPKLVLLNVSAETSEDVIRLGGKALYDAGYVKPSYTQFVLDREAEAPTGIPTPGIKVALPHTDADYVNSPGAVFMQLQKPVKFISMEDLTTPLPVELVFQLALTDGHQQISALKSLMHLFYDAEKLQALKNAKDVKDAMSILDEIQIN